MVTISRLLDKYGSMAENICSIELLRNIWSVSERKLPYRATNGFWFQTISREPAVRKAVDDIVLDLYGEGNPCWEEDYELNPSEEMQMGGM